MLTAESVTAELEELWCLIEQQRVEIQSLRRQIEVQRRFMAYVAAELVAIQRATSIPQPTQGSPSNGNGHRAGRRLRSETIPQGTARNSRYGRPSEA